MSYDNVCESGSCEDFFLHILHITTSTIDRAARKRDPTYIQYIPYIPCDIGLSGRHGFAVIPETSDVVSFLEADDIKTLVSAALDGR